MLFCLSFRNYIYIMHLWRFWIIAFFVLGTVPAFALDVCEFDELLMDGFIKMYSVGGSAAHELLDDIAQKGEHIEPGDCQGARYKKLQKDAGFFLTTNGHLKKNLYFNELNLEDEEVALLNLLFDYVLAKYHSPYSFERNKELKSKSEKEALLLMLSELASVSISVLWSEIRNPTPAGIAANMAVSTLPSWVYLWIRNDNPFKHDSDYDINYSWILVKRDIFLTSFPDSKYAEPLKVLVNKESVYQMWKRDYDRMNFHFGMTYVIGKSLFNSTWSDVDEMFAYGFQARFQIFSALVLLQVDGIYGNDVSWGGISLFGGYALIDKEKFGVDIFGGISGADETITYYDEEYLKEKENKNSFFAFAAGIQVFKRFSVGDMLDALPKFQWMIQVAPAYVNGLTNREGVGVMNRFYIGIGFDGKVPMGDPRK